MKQCPQCGFENPDPVRFCGGCGAALKTTASDFKPFATERTLVDQDRPPLPASVYLGGTLVDAGVGSAGSLMPSLTGKIFNKDRVDAKIAEGGMGSVWKTAHMALRVELALKVMPEDFAGSTTLTERFQCQAQVMAQFKHPHLVQAYGLAARTAFTTSA